ncbi:hypothetical protein SAMN05421776_105359 [Nocardia farcinica]|uniref:Protein of uncharacterized function (DUF1360) n=1 Tax=Nocardia farcinica TaxID=37329 RepID=A0A0H5NEC4_NOCFR|nr:hypothetical protein [Nocardia farcinica]AXK88854.1 hypothetical protein DXT66_27380 [Nocardia farcinica]MBA4858037.1 hypothetical protein [Nocardia farcinica]MBC9819432.1 hypothetical protein [Nocardia farcinica]PFX04020.1 hypothetical protein CJ469_01894 [Nocardia farcinica]PFX10178.1 hypothetical protein CJ468_01025 [Nocardia farcinica]
MLTVVALVVYTLTVARLTRLITTDKLTAPLRDAVLARRGGESAVTFLMFCPWCMSVWVAAALALPAAWAAGVPWWWAPGLALAASQVTGLLARGDLE